MSQTEFLNRTQKISNISKKECGYYYDKSIYEQTTEAIKELYEKARIKSGHIVIAARTRPDFIGGGRAVCSDEIL